MRQRLDALGTLESAAVLRIIAGLLHLGNISFAMAADGEKVVVAADNGGGGGGGGGGAADGGAALRRAAGLLGVEAAALQRALLSRQMSVDGRASAYAVPRDLRQTIDARDALAKTIYARLFAHVVEHINAAMGADDAADADDDAADGDGGGGGAVVGRRVGGTARPLRV